MKKIDLHVHSRYSSDSQNPFIKSMKSSESYTEPEEIYAIARERGMNLVTITDHDAIKGCLALKEKYPDSVIMGVESTVFFPEDNCPVHILVYGFTVDQFEEFNKLRLNIYEFRDYLKKNKLPCSVAHATYRLKNKLGTDHVEKLILLFDVFEGINGCRNEVCNNGFMEILNSLTPETMERLYRKHNIEPFSVTPWIKGHTAGSDDHAGLFIGNTYTEIDGETAEDVLGSLRCGKMRIHGNSRDYRLFAFQIYKIIYDNFNSKNKNRNIMLKTLNDLLLFDRVPEFPMIRERHCLKKLKNSTTPIKTYVNEILKITGKKNMTHDEKLKMIYSRVVDFSDEIILGFAFAAYQSLVDGTPLDIMKSLPPVLAGLFMYIPVSFAMIYIHKDIHFQKELDKAFMPQKNHRKKILWFTDTINDLNGVSVTLRNIGWLAHQSGEELFLVSSVLDSEPDNDLPPNLINLKALYSFRLPYYDKLTVKVPSFLKMIETLHHINPDEIYISSPSVIGLYGLLYAKLIGVKCNAVYHTDFTMQARNIIDAESPLISIIEGYTKWFHEAADKILVPTREYIEILTKRNFNRNKLGIFYRGIDAAHFEPKEEGKKYLNSKLNLNPGINLVYVGRISEDKNIDFLLEVYKKLMLSKKNINLIFVGDGPYFEILRNKTSKIKSIHFTGEIPNKMLPLVYSGSDILVFPSETDTFGMVVLEAQSCGLPAIVANTGGPKDIIRDKDTGFVLGTDNTETWISKLEEIIDWIEHKDNRYSEMRKKARNHVLVNFEKNMAIKNIFAMEDNNSEQ